MRGVKVREGVEIGVFWVDFWILEGRFGYRGGVWESDECLLGEIGGGEDGVGWIGCLWGI